MQLLLFFLSLPIPLTKPLPKTSGFHERRTGKELKAIFWVCSELMIKLSLSCKWVIFWVCSELMIKLSLSCKWVIFSFKRQRNSWWSNLYQTSLNFNGFELEICL
jgi:hypothetical protein